MKTRIKRLWSKALRSGKYKQGKCRLRSKGKYCCLGVLGDIYAKETGVRWNKAKDGSVMTTYSIHGSSAELPHEVQNWAGINSGNPTIEHSFLTALNDSGRKTFKQIATLINKYL